MQFQKKICLRLEFFFSNFKIRKDLGVKGDAKIAFFSYKKNLTNCSKSFLWCWFWKKKILFFLIYPLATEEFCIKFYSKDVEQNFQLLFLSPIKSSIFTLTASWLKQFPKPEVLPMTIFSFCLRDNWAT